jgi:hypothetical protein
MGLETFPSPLDANVELSPVAKQKLSTRPKRGTLYWEPDVIHGWRAIEHAKGQPLVVTDSRSLEAFYLAFFPTLTRSASLLETPQFK